MEVEAAAGPGAWNEEFVLEKTRWRLPEGMVRHEGDADPGNLRILRVRGNSMEPEMREGDRRVASTLSWSAFAPRRARSSRQPRLTSRCPFESPSPSSGVEVNRSPNAGRP